ncbi:MAG: hypothetical protein HY698_08290 [Deltaproteobacteria bacterium]|nr:hypothetical protein [Deltaproteobacteria bacterium]
MRIRHHVNPLKLEFLVPRTPQVPIPPGKEVELELGCADAQFLFQRAAQDPGRVELGVEIREDLVRDVNRRARALGLNVKAIFANANVDLRFLLEPGTIARIFVNFPDPWFKRRHRKRRVIDRDLIVACHEALRPRGEFFFQSDVWDLALDAMSVIEAQEERLENLAGPWSFWKEPNPYGARSLREELNEQEGKQIWRMLFRKRDEADEAIEGRARGIRAP